MKFRWRNALGILLSVALLLWTMHNVDIGSVLENLKRANPLLILATAVAGTLIFPLRARRWQTILDPIAQRLPFGILWRATAIGMMANNVAPARAGEVARAYALTRETPRVGFSAAFASLAVDRAFDAFVVLLLMVIAMFDSAFPKGRLIAGEPISRWLWSGTVLLAAVVAVLYLIVFFPGPMIRMYELLARRVAPRYEQRGREALLAFANGLSVLRHPWHFLAVLWWALAHWLLNALAFWIGFRAVGIHAPFSAALVLQGVIAIGVALPSAPGFFGIFEYIGQQGLGLYGVDPTRATAWAIGFHLATFVPITVMGIYYFGRLGMHFRDIGEASGTAGEAAETAAGTAPPPG